MVRIAFYNLLLAGLLGALPGYASTDVPYRNFCHEFMSNQVALDSDRHRAGLNSTAVVPVVLDSFEKNFIYDRFGYSKLWFVDDQGKIRLRTSILKQLVRDYKLHVRQHGRFGELQYNLTMSPEYDIAKPLQFVADIFDHSSTVNISTDLFGRLADFKWRRLDGVRQSTHVRFVQSSQSCVPLYFEKGTSTTRTFSNNLVFDLRICDQIRRFPKDMSNLTKAKMIVDSYKYFHPLEVVAYSVIQPHVLVRREVEKCEHFPFIHEALNREDVQQAIHAADLQTH